MRVLHITAIVQRAKDTEILYFRRLLNSNVWSPDCRANCSNLDFWSFSWSCVDILGSHSEEQFLGVEVVHRRIFSSQSSPTISEERAMWFLGCVLISFVLFIRYLPHYWLVWEDDALGEGAGRSHAWSHQAGKPSVIIPCWHMEQGDNAQK